MVEEVLKRRLLPKKRETRHDTLFAFVQPTTSYSLSL
jgi:hypothetical protein